MCGCVCVCVCVRGNRIPFSVSSLQVEVNVTLPGGDGKERTFTVSRKLTELHVAIPHSQFLSRHAILSSSHSRHSHLLSFYSNIPPPPLSCLPPLTLPSLLPICSPSSLLPSSLPPSLHLSHQLILPSILQLPHPTSLFPLLRLPSLLLSLPPPLPPSSSPFLPGQGCQ